MTKLAKTRYHREESKGLEFEKDYVEGIAVRRGYISPYFVTDSEHGIRNSGPMF